jgi:dTDP-4-amino-4,6-dideoxygalactose transaminase
VGTFGRVGLFSLGLTKPVWSISGAVLVTDDADLADSIRSSQDGLPVEGRRSLLLASAEALGLRLLTSPALYAKIGLPLVGFARAPGVRVRLDRSGVPVAGGAAGDTLSVKRQAFGDLQARAARRSLARLDAVLARHRALAALYRRGLDGLPGLGFYQGPADHEGSQWVFPILHADAARLRAWLARHGIDAAPPAVHACHALVERPELRADLPVATRLFRECLCLPLHVGLSAGDIERVVDAVRRFCSA